MAATSHSGLKNTIRPMRYLLFIASILVLTIGLSLYLLSEQTELYFAWTIGVPLTAAFLGGGYLTSFLLEFLSARETLWAKSRLAVPAVLIFTALTLIVTLMHLDRFHFNAPDAYTVIGTWVWFLVYLTVPFAMSIVLVLQWKTRGDEPTRQSPLPRWMRIVLFLQGGVMIVLGIGLFLSPMTFASLWVWELTPLTGRAIGAWLVGLGIAAGHAGLEDDWARLRATMISYIVFAVLQGIALARFPGAAGLDWSAPKTWLYIAFLLSLMAAGVYGMMQVNKAISRTS